MTPHHNSLGDHAGEIGGVSFSVLCFLYDKFTSSEFIGHEFEVIFNAGLTAGVGWLVVKILKSIFPDKKKDKDADK